MTPESGLRRSEVTPRPGEPPVWRVTLAGWAAGLAVTLAIVAIPSFVFGFRSPSLHLVLDTVDACVALLVAYLLHGRYVRRGRLQDLLLSQALVLLAIAGLGLSYVADLVGDSSPGTLDVWLPLAVRVVGAVLVVASAFTGGRIHRVPLLQRWPAIPAVVAVGLVTVVVTGLGDRLPVALDITQLPSSAHRPLLEGHVLLLTAQACTALCFLAASIAFTAQAARHHDELLMWLGPACALAGFARVNYVLFPSIYTDWLYTGDVLRTSSYLLLLVGALREMRQYWSSHAQVAVLADRHRLARELHDGVIQELTFIRGEGRAIPADIPQGTLIVDACDRALDEARSAVQALAHAGDDPLSLTLHRGARQVADRYQVRMEVELDDSVTADFEQRHALLRIAREAVSNAARHGRAACITLQLAQRDGRRRLVITDDGQGFDVEAAVGGATGYGLISMRDRARGLPGEVRVESSPGAGSIVEVTW